MSALDYATPDQRDQQDPIGKIRDRIRQAKEDRRKYEPVWMSNLAFVAGKHYHVYDRFSRTMMMPKTLEDAASRGELYTADIITERRMRALGELSADDDRPELLLIDDGDGREDFQQQLNKAVAFGWDHEWHGDVQMLDLRRKLIDLGTAAVRVRFDNTVGPVKGQMPAIDGKPVLDPDQARELMGGGPRPDVSMLEVREGRIRWEVLSPFNLLVPPGVEHEDLFPWECVVRPVLLQDVKDQYGDAAAMLVEDTDIGSIIGTDTNANPDTSTGSQGNRAQGRLRDHVWLYTYYERPTSGQPQGRVYVFAGAQMQLLTDQPEPLPYCRPDGTYSAGISYFHWWRVTGRFFSRSLVEPMKDIQRRVNKRTNQIDKTIDRGQPFVIVDKNGEAAKRKGFPVELLALEPSERQPVVSSGVSPGPWMYQDKEDALSDLERASGIGQAALGENPSSVNTYSQLALLNEQESSKRSVIRKEHQIAVNRLVEYSVHDIRTYWGPDKQILLDSDDDRVQARVFNATQVPTFFIVRAASGAPKPRSQAAELQKVNDIWQAVLATATFQADPPRWIRWYRESLDAGQALELPETASDSQTDKAELENTLLAGGQMVQPAYYDSAQIHIPAHRDAQTEADMAGEQETVAAIEQHIQMHLQMQQQVSQQLAQIQPSVPQPPDQQPVEQAHAQQANLAAQLQQQQAQAQQQQQSKPKG